MRHLIVLFCFAFLLATGRLYGGTGDTTHVITHRGVRVVTDPKQGYNTYLGWGVFPRAGTSYRTAVLTVTYQCPDSQRCGEWDYVDNVRLRRVGGSASPSRDLEIARLISPYGSRFAPDWKFSWRIDITDYAPLLHDSVELEFRHDGYESNTDRGWKVTLDVALVEGPPAMELVGVQKLWDGEYLYGDTLARIEDSLRAVAFETPAGAAVARLRILQTGHGMDTVEGCAEFCSKYRQVTLDDSVMDQRQIWRECGFNPVFPQAGTWIFNRANWCPGSMVAPDIVDLEVAAGSHHTVGMKMEPFVNKTTQQARYRVSAYLFFYRSPRAENDATLEGIIAPSTLDEYSRLNPVCDNPQILVKNNGRIPLRSVTVRYGLSGVPEQSYDWKGTILPTRDLAVTLPGLLGGGEGTRTFRAELRAPNGDDDAYRADNAQTSTARVAPLYPSPVIVLFRTNNDTTHTSYVVRDAGGAVVAQRQAAGLRRQTLYRDTLALPPGCYELAVTDTAGDGLDFWYNVAGGYGYLRMTTLSGALLKAFPSDFGSRILHEFRVAGPGATQGIASDTTPILNMFPIRNPGKFFVDLFLDTPGTLSLRITTEDASRLVYDKTFENFKEGMIDVDISAEPNGFYMVSATADGRTVTKKMKLRKD
jgi:hypothetical protein